MSPDEPQFFVDIERRTRRSTNFAGYEWELREGEFSDAHLVTDSDAPTRGQTVTLRGARWEARRAKRRVLKLRGSKYLPREAV